MSKMWIWWGNFYDYIRPRGYQNWVDLYLLQSKLWLSMEKTSRWIKIYLKDFVGKYFGDNKEFLLLLFSLPLSLTCLSLFCDLKFLCFWDCLTFRSSSFNWLIFSYCLYLMFISFWSYFLKPSITELLLFIVQVFIVDPIFEIDWRDLFNESFVLLI